MTKGILSIKTIPLKWKRKYLSCSLINVHHDSFSICLSFFKWSFSYLLAVAFVFNFRLWRWPTKLFSKWHLSKPRTCFKYHPNGCWDVWFGKCTRCFLAVVVFVHERNWVAVQKTNRARRCFAWSFLSSQLWTQTFGFKLCSLDSWRCPIPLKSQHFWRFTVVYLTCHGPRALTISQFYN